jgi:hypothetical protein
MKPSQLNRMFSAVCKGSIFSFFVAQGALAVETSVDELFSSLQERGGSAEDVIAGLMEGGVELNTAAGYTVSNSESIGLSIAYAQAAVCLAPDQPTAQAVGQVAADSAGQAARNAVQAGVVAALSSYAKGECRLLLDELNNASQAFAAPGGAAAGDSSAGGGAPSIPTDETSTSPSQ